MIEKKYIKSRKTYKVTFTVPDTELPENLHVESLSVAGDFNDWNPETAPMKRNKQGVYWADPFGLDSGNRNPVFREYGGQWRDPGVTPSG